ncbi:hypothetical protein CC78DRAFT_63245 [Lojkania enalia]|uniref:Zn(2)-C6 fungal-type domain-containing protein n=1 Tax=Lojkania enalia TaxID=147567 RepID=A0A9P4KGB8_9PLEO|nr:hypothetical protein CC78DRAFT_63245 [Didymosphaeria enalia]
MDENPSSTRPIDRVALACIQCRARHVKCDATQPVCNRCRRDGKECTYLKSRRGGLDKAALARRRLALQQAERAQQADDSVDYSLSAGNSQDGEREDHTTVPEFRVLNIVGSMCAASSLTHNINPDRLLDLYYDNFHPSTPVVLPLYYLSQRRLSNSHCMENLLSVLHWIGSIYSPSVPSEPYYEVANEQLNKILPKTAFSVQALLLFAIAQHHYNLRPESRNMLDLAIGIALEIGMNTKDFAKQHGEGNPVLEESWRRTYYFLHLCDQHFAVIVSSPFYALRDISNEVDLPCDDEVYESGQIPPSMTWKDYEERELAEEEIVFSSIVYLFDIATIVPFIMKQFLQTGTFGDGIISSVDAKLAIWRSLLPISKKDPMRPTGKVDEVMFLAHMIATIITMNTHRPFSSLTYSIEELSTKSFSSPVPFVEPLKQGRGAHTARALKAADLQTKLLAIPCNMEHHHVFTLCIVASMATAQVSACNILLEGHALSLARDRVRLSIGYLNAMGAFWPLGKKMAREVKNVARGTLSGAQKEHAINMDPDAEIEIPQDNLIWPVDTSSAHVDIYSGIVLPMDWGASLNPSSSSSTLS